jgi:hypothetical protein
MSTGPDPQNPFELAVSVARLEVKVDNLTSAQRDIVTAVEQLKARRFPVTTMAMIFAGVGGAAGLYTAVRGH